MKQSSQKNSKYSGAQALAECLRLNGVQHIFFVTGNPLNLWPALEEEGLRLILARSERAAAFMADGYARVSRQPGVCFAQQGPGAVNLIPGVAEAWMASSPVVAITHNRGPALAQKNMYQELDQMALFEPISKFNFQIGDPARIEEAVRNAFRIAISGNPRPVHLDFLDVVATGAAERPDRSGEVTIHRPPLQRGRPEAAQVRAACAALRAAERPVIVAGHGVMISQAWDEVRELAELLSIPVATTLSGKGSLAETHPRALGVVGLYSRNCANQVVSEADLVFFIGCKAGGMATDNFRVPPVGTRIIHLDIDPQEIGRNYPTEIALVGDARSGLQDCLAELRASVLDPDTTWAEHSHQRVQAWQRSAQEFFDSDQQPIHPARVMHELREFLDDDALVVADTGYMGAWVGTLYETRIPGQTVIRAAGSLGWAFPAALGAKLAAPERRVVAVTGDGGLGYHLPELETAVRCQVPFVTVLLNNVSLAFEYHVLKYMQGGRAYAASDFVDVDHARVALEYGAYGRRVHAPGDIRAALAEAFDSGKPAIVEVMVDKEAIPPLTSYESVMSKPL